MTANSLKRNLKNLNSKIEIVIGSRCSLFILKFIFINLLILKGPFGPSLIYFLINFEILNLK